MAETAECSKNLEYKLQYVEFTPRSYGVAVHGAQEGEPRHNKPFIDPASFFFARWFLNNPEQKLRMIASWLPEVSKSPRKRGYTPIFTFDEEVLVNVGDSYKDGTSKRTWKILTELIPEQLAENSRQRLFSLNRSYNMFDLSAEDVFFLNDDSRKGQRPIVKDGTWLCSSMKRKGGGSRVREYNRVEIAGPFEKSKVPLARIISDTEDSRFAAMKQGNTPLEYVCTSTAALMYLAWRNPGLVKGLKALQKSWKGAKVWLPFNPQEVQSIPRNLYTVKQGKQPPLDILAVDARFDMEFNGATKFDVAKKLSRVAVIYDPMLWGLIVNEKAGFEVLPNKYIIGRSHSMPKPLRKWYNDYKAFLKREGFEEVGTVLEKKDSAHEVVAQRFVRKSDGHEKRILWSKEYPPLIVERTPKKGEAVDVFNRERRRSPYRHMHPVTELFQHKSMFDDYGREMTNYRVVIPTEVFIPQPMIRDYHTMFKMHAPEVAKTIVAKAKKGDTPENMARIYTILAQGKQRR